MGSDSLGGSEWGNVHQWKLFLPPSRPAYYQLELIEKRLDEISGNQKVAVLGSTPEFRNRLAQRDNTDVWVFEKNIGFYNTVSSLCAHTSSENLVTGDWRETLEQCDQEFDMILSDSTIGNIPYSDRESFYSNIADVLSDTGVFVDKVLKNDAPPQSLTALDAEFQSRPNNLETLNDFANAYFFTSELTYTDEIVDVNSIYATLRERFSDPGLRRLLTQTIDLLYTPGSVWYYGRKWDSVKQDYYANLQKVEEVSEPPDSPFYQRGGVIISESLS